MNSGDIGIILYIIMYMYYFAISNKLSSVHLLFTEF